MSETIELPDGRALEVFAADGEGTPVLFHHGTPSSGMLHAPRAADAAERGLRLVSWSRPGYGASDRKAGRAVADVAGDVAAVADWLGAERFYTAGLSGGGPHSLAAAALLPERVLAAASIGGVAPYGADGLDWLQGMGQENIDEFGAALAGEAELRPFLEELGDQMRGATAEALLEVLGSLVSPPDQHALDGELAEFFARSGAHALEPGIWGWFDDDIAFTQPWGFDLDDIRTPVAVWQGRQDNFVPYSHGEWLAANVDGASTHLYEDEGHLSLAESQFGAILDQMVEAAG